MRLFAWIALFCVGCGGAEQALVVDVDNGEKTAPAAVTVSVFNAYGLMGRSSFDHPHLPGRLTIAGMPATPQAVRVAAAAADPLLLAGVRFDYFPLTNVTQTLTLQSDTLDSDGDGVPDIVDDCPTVPDPDQQNSDGQGGGDACSGDGGGFDLAPPPPGDQSVVPVEQDLSVITVKPGDDLATTLNPPPPQDMAKAPIVVDMAKFVGVDLLTPPSDDMANIPIVADGFENGITGATWTTYQTNGFVSTTPNYIHRGNYSLHAEVNSISSGGSATGQVVETIAVPLPDLYVRVFAYVLSGFDPASVTILTVEQAASPHKAINLNLVGGSFATTNSVSTSTTTTTATTPTMPTNQWVCLEWHIHSATDGFAKAYVNGAEVSALTFVEPLAPSPAFSAVGIGLAGTAASAEHDIYLDDFAVDKYPIGCTK